MFLKKEIFCYFINGLFIKVWLIISSIDLELIWQRDQGNTERQRCSALKIWREFNLLIELPEKLLGYVNTGTHTLNAILILLRVIELYILNLKTRVNFKLKELLETTHSLFLQYQLLINELKIYTIGTSLNTRIKLKVVHTSLTKSPYHINYNLYQSKIITFNHISLSALIMECEVDFWTQLNIGLNKFLD